MRHARGLSLIAALSIVVLSLASSVGPSVAQESSSWSQVDYGRLVDRRAISHLGETAGAMLDRLKGSPLPRPDDSPLVRASRRQLAVMLEGHSFVLPDAIDARGPMHDPPFVDVSELYVPGRAQPAWVELVRAGRYVVESDGAGMVRLFLPWEPAAVASRFPKTPDIASIDAARQAWDAAWSVIRHPLRAESRRRVAEGGEASLRVVVHPYAHFPEVTIFHLGNEPFETNVSEFAPPGDKPPLDLRAIAELLDAGLQIEGGRLSAGGALTLFGSPPSAPPELIGDPVGLSDLAVAYRALFHGGPDLPYMSLDRSPAPHMAAVNYGGRLRDTRLGLVSLLCDARFKTFSLGIDAIRGGDVRDEVRRDIPGFRTHVERASADPAAAENKSQQTRFWFYPDAVDLTVASSGDLMAVRTARMSAASERTGELGGAGTGEALPAWTETTIARLNENYDALARRFPELASLDQEVRLLSLMSWLRGASDEGLELPELSSLLAVELPAVVTPRRYPNALTYNAALVAPMPEKNGTSVFDRQIVGDVLDRFEPRTYSRPDAAEEARRLLPLLDARSRQQSALGQELYETVEAGGDELTVDTLIYRAKRVRMHELSLATLPQSSRDELTKRQESEGELRVFSTAIGGIDLSMTSALERATSRSGSLGWEGGFGSSAPGTIARPVTSEVPESVRELWQADPPELRPSVLPGHGLPRGDGATPRRVTVGGVDVEWSEHPGGWIASGLARESSIRFVQRVADADGPEVESRRLVYGGGGELLAVERLREGRHVSYALETNGGTTVAVPLETSPLVGEPDRVADARPPNFVAPPKSFGALVPTGLVLMEVGVGPAQPGRVSVRLRSSFSELEAELPRVLFRRAVAGPVVDAQPDVGLPGLLELPPQLGDVRQVMIGAPPPAEPWAGPAAPPAPDEDPLSLAAGLSEWWTGREEATGGVGGPTAVVVRTDTGASMTRWELSPPVASSLLLVERGDLAGVSEGVRERLAAAWGKKRTVSELPESVSAPLVVYATSASPSSLAIRLRELASDARLDGKLLLVASFGGRSRPDLPAVLLREGGLAGIGMIETGLVAIDRQAAELQEVARRIESRRSAPDRVETLSSLVTWFY